MASVNLTSRIQLSFRKCQQCYCTTGSCLVTRHTDGSTLISQHRVYSPTRMHHYHHTLWQTVLSATWPLTKIAQMHIQSRQSSQWDMLKIARLTPKSSIVLINWMELKWLCSRNPQYAGDIKPIWFDADFVLKLPQRLLIIYPIHVNN